jgi:hypothetical protein
MHAHTHTHKLTWRLGCMICLNIRARTVLMASPCGKPMFTRYEISGSMRISRSRRTSCVYACICVCVCTRDLRFHARTSLQEGHGASGARLLRKGTVHFQYICWHVCAHTLHTSFVYVCMHVHICCWDLCIYAHVLNVCTRVTHACPACTRGLSLNQPQSVCLCMHTRGKCCQCSASLLANSTNKYEDIRYIVFSFL